MARNLVSTSFQSLPWADEVLPLRCAKHLLADGQANLATLDDCHSLTTNQRAKTALVPLNEMIK